MTPLAELFECPKCGGNRLEEIEVGVIVSTPIIAVGPDYEVDYDYAMQTMEASHGTEIDRHQCVDCGWELPKDLEEDNGLWDILTSPESPCKPKGAPE